MGSVTEDYTLTSEQKTHFLEHGFVKIPGCFTREQAEKFTEGMWTRLGMDPDDKSTWTAERTNMPGHRYVSVAEFAPRAWSAMCQLLGGEERIALERDSGRWSDAFIVNLGKEEYSAEQELDMRHHTQWHVDGDFFVHFLDSKEQGLLVIPLWTDIVPKAGGTLVCSDGIKVIAQHLYEHPEGTTPWMQSISNTPHVETLDFFNEIAHNPSKTRDSSFHEMTGNVGDVVLMSPFILHTASQNLLRVPRVITNPPISLKQPFELDRNDASQFSLVEQSILRALGKPDGLKGWKVTGKREGYTSNRMKRVDAMRQKELERLNQAKAQKA